jgi:hypothetical protein
MLDFMESLADFVTNCNGSKHRHNLGCARGANASPFPHPNIFPERYFKQLFGCCKDRKNLKNVNFTGCRIQA